MTAHLPGNVSAAVRPPRRHRLAECHLVSGAPLEALRAFYGDTLGLRTAMSQETLAVRAGDSRLLFRHDPSAGHPFYHFAFNIPENKIRLARDWQAERSALIPIPEGNRAAGFPPDVVDYSHWNAHSVFFLDPAGNVVEYIARHDLRNASAGPFTPADILHISEIAFVVDDVPGTSELFRRRFALTGYRASSDDFAALGDEHGLVLIMRRGRIIDFNQESQDKAVRVFPTRLTLRSPAPGSLRMEGFPYEIHTA